MATHPYVVGQKVKIITPKQPASGMYGFNPDMEQMLDDGKIYKIAKIEDPSNHEAYVILEGCPWSWLFNYIQPVSTVNDSTVLAVMDELSDETEDNDPYGLIAQRKALKQMIGC